MSFPVRGGGGVGGGGGRGWRIQVFGIGGGLYQSAKIQKKTLNVIIVCPQEVKCKLY